jgi:hypothetical protein
MAEVSSAVPGSRCGDSGRGQSLLDARLSTLRGQNAPGREGRGSTVDDCCTPAEHLAQQERESVAERAQPDALGGNQEQAHSSLEAVLGLAGCVPGRCLSRRNLCRSIHVVSPLKTCCNLRTIATSSLVPLQHSDWFEAVCASTGDQRAGAWVRRSTRQQRSDRRQRRHSVATC